MLENKINNLLSNYQNLQNSYHLIKTETVTYKLNLEYCKPATFGEEVLFLHWNFGINYIYDQILWAETRETDRKEQGVKIDRKIEDY